METKLNFEQQAQVDALLMEYISEEEARSALLATLTTHGLCGVAPMRAVGALQRQGKVKQGLYQQLLNLNSSSAVDSTKVGDADALRDKANKQSNPKKRAPKASVLPESVALENLDAERFNPEAFPGVKYLTGAPAHCYIGDKSLVEAGEESGFSIFNVDVPLKPSDKIFPVFRNIWKRRSPASVIFDMLADSVDGYHPDEMGAVVGDANVDKFLKQYTVNWRYCGWFVGFNETTGKYRFFFAHPGVMYPEGTKHADYEKCDIEFKQVLEA